MRLVHTRGICSSTARSISCRLAELQSATYCGKHIASVFLLAVTFLRCEGGLQCRMVFVWVLLFTVCGKDFKN